MTRGGRGPALLLLAAVALPLAAAVVVLASGAPRAAAEAEEFEGLVGGLGLGAAVDLSRCAAAFDPRDGNACSSRHDPVPLGSLHCPAHSGG